MCVRSEIEARDACFWLLAAGFPQYVQLYEGRFYSTLFYTHFIAPLAVCVRHYRAGGSILADSPCWLISAYGIGIVQRDDNKVSKSSSIQSELRWTHTSYCASEYLLHPGVHAYK